MKPKQKHTTISFKAKAKPPDSFGLGSNIATSSSSIDVSYVEPTATSNEDQNVAATKKRRRDLSTHQKMEIIRTKMDTTAPLDNTAPSDKEEVPNEFERVFFVPLVFSKRKKATTKRREKRRLNDFLLLPHPPSRPDECPQCLYPLRAKTNQVRVNVVWMQVPHPKRTDTLNRVGNTKCSP